MSRLLKSKKVLQLRPQRPAANEPATQMAISVRAQLSLLQGYAEIIADLQKALELFHNVEEVKREAAKFMKVKAVCSRIGGMTVLCPSTSGS